MDFDPKGDYLVHGLDQGGQLRCAVARTTRLVERARRLHDLSPLAAAALGRSLTAALLLAHTALKDEERLTLRVRGDGPLGAIIADAGARGEVRGYVQVPDVMLPLNARQKLDVGRAVGRGELSVSRDRKNRQFYSSTVELVSGEIGDDVAAYLHRSEQIPSAVALGVHVHQDGHVDGAGGFLLQVMPGGEGLEAQADDAARRLKPISALMQQGVWPEEVFHMLLPDGRVLGRKPLAFRCDCSRKRTRRALAALGRDQLQTILEEDGQAELRCHFCAKTYLWLRPDLEKLVEEATQAP